MSNSFVNKIMAMYSEHQLDQVSKSWCLQDKWEKRHRLRTVVALSVELEAIREKSAFATGFGEMAIEAVVEGNWREIDQLVEFLTFRSEGDRVAADYGPLWEKFRIVAAAASATAARRAPGTEPRPS